MKLLMNNLWLILYSHRRRHKINGTIFITIKWYDDEESEKKK